MDKQPRNSQSVKEEQTQFNTTAEILGHLPRAPIAHSTVIGDDANLRDQHIHGGVQQIGAQYIIQPNSNSYTNSEPNRSQIVEQQDQLTKHIINYANENRLLAEEDRGPLELFLQNQGFRCQRNQESRLICDDKNLGEQDLSESDFSKVSFRRANFTKSNIKKVIFNEADLTEAEISWATGIEPMELAKAIITKLRIQTEDQVGIRARTNAKVIQQLQKKLETIQSENERLREEINQLSNMTSESSPKVLKIKK